MKRLVICFDGTWNRLDSKHPTNVVLTAQSVQPTAADGHIQTIFYDEGVGTEKTEKVRGGAFGRGLLKNLSDGYRFLVFNYDPGDEIYVFGFSRGAYTARSFVGLLGVVGVILRHEAAKIDQAIDLYKTPNRETYYPGAAEAFRAECSPYVVVSDADSDWRRNNGYADQADAERLTIRYLGVWDTVGALGIPNHLSFSGWFNKRHQFHDTSLSSLVVSARHAVAIDERRKTFSPTLWDNLEVLNRNREAEFDGIPQSAPFQQMWFPGVHGAVGGGGDRHGLSDHALEWIWDGARQAGLDLDDDRRSVLYALDPDHRDYLKNSSEKPGLFWRLLSCFASDRDPGPESIPEVSISALRRWHMKSDELPEKKPYRPKSLQRLASDLEKNIPSGSGLITGMDAENTLTTHVVKRGETLSKIAKIHYGSAREELWRGIFKANTDKLDHPDRIYVGYVLRIPRITIKNGSHDATGNKKAKK